jgi:hypothetical protein
MVMLLGENSYLFHQFTNKFSTTKVKYKKKKNIKGGKIDKKISLSLPQPLREQSLVPSSHSLTKDNRSFLTSLGFKLK